MTEYMTVEELHEFQNTGRMPRRFRKQRSEVLMTVANEAPDVAETAATAIASPTRTKAQPKANIDSPGPALTITEKAFQSLVEQAARAAGWMVYHTYNSRRSEPGFPDLTMVHPRDGRLVFAELKTMKGELSEAQKAWTSALEWAGQEVYVWKPGNWSEIEAVLTGQVQ